MTARIKEAVAALQKQSDLTGPQMREVMEAVMSGSVSTPDIVAFLLALTEKGETAEEVASAVDVMREYALHVHARDQRLLDTCGTGGDRKHTFNISTAASFVASASGITVAKHGNRSVSSSSGSADILEALGINICAEKACVEKCLDELGIAFLYAVQFHPAMKHAMPARRQIGSRTLFNFLGPLSNPAGATHQLIGVSDERWAALLAQTLARLNPVHALVVRGADGLDEATTMDRTVVFDIRGTDVAAEEIDAADFGIRRTEVEKIRGSSPSENARILVDLFKGAPGPYRDIVVFNAACALYAADAVGDDLRQGILQGIRLAEQSIDSGKAFEKMALLKKYTNTAWEKTS